MCVSYRKVRMNKKEFYQASKEELSFVPLDIETTGFKAADGDFITNVVLHNNGLYHIWINTDGNEVEASEMESEIIEKADLDNLVLYVCEDERQLLLNIQDYLETHTDEYTILTAFNGETYKGNTDFDLPFLRTRCLKNGVEWILEGFWYTDTYDVYSDSSRFDTTIQSEPSLNDMIKDDIQQFADDMGYDIHYSRMLKDELVREIENHDSLNADVLRKWAIDNLKGFDPANLRAFDESELRNFLNDQNIEPDEDAEFDELVGLAENVVDDDKVVRNWAEENEIMGVNPEDPSTFNKGNLESFIDSMSVDISYDTLSVDDLIREIRERGYSNDMLEAWHEETGRSIGTEEVGTLDDIHEHIVEDMHNDKNWRDNLPFDIEVFEPFDPYDESGEAVTGYMNGDYVGVILHCFADVARTVNLTRVMQEYTPKKDYKPKVL